MTPSAADENALCYSQGQAGQGDADIETAPNEGIVSFSARSRAACTCPGRRILKPATPLVSEGEKLDEQKIGSPSGASRSCSASVGENIYKTTRRIAGGAIPQEEAKPRPKRASRRRATSGGGRTLPEASRKRGRGSERPQKRPYATYRPPCSPLIACSRVHGGPFKER